jgi:replicative DNA helicase
MADIKIPSASLEPMVLNLLINDRNFFLKVHEFLEPSFFSNPHISNVYKLMRRYLQEYRKIPLLSTVKVMVEKTAKEEDERNNRLMVGELVYGKMEYDVEYVKAEAQKFIKNASVTKAIYDSYEDLDEGNFEAVHSKIKKAVSLTFDRNLGREVASSVNDVLKDDPIKQIKTMFPTLDRLFDGGVEEASLMIIAANSGIGKSIMMHNIAANVYLQAKNVVYYSMEMSAKRLLRRIYSTMTNIDSDVLNNNVEKVNEYYTTLSHTNNGARLFVVEYPAKTASANTLRSNLDDLLMYEDFVPDLILSDYVTIMKPNDLSSDNSYERVKTICEEVRGVGQERGIPIISASQINRGGLNKTSGGTKDLITSADIADSLGIQQTADYLVIQTQSIQEKQDGIINLYVDKNRNGKNGQQIPCIINYKTLKMKENL